MVADMAKRKRYPAWEVKWEMAMLRIWPKAWKDWRAKRAVYVTKADARQHHGQLMRRDGTRNIRLRPLDYADKDGA